MFRPTYIKLFFILVVTFVEANNNAKNNEPSSEPRISTYEGSNSGNNHSLQHRQGNPLKSSLYNFLHVLADLEEKYSKEDDNEEGPKFENTKPELDWGVQNPFLSTGHKRVNTNNQQDTRPRRTNISQNTQDMDTQFWNTRGKKSYNRPHSTLHPAFWSARGKKSTALGHLSDDDFIRQQITSQLNQKKSGSDLKINVNQPELKPKNPYDMFYMTKGKREDIEEGIINYNKFDQQIPIDAFWLPEDKKSSDVKIAILPETENQSPYDIFYTTKGKRQNEERMSLHNFARTYPLELLIGKKSNLNFPNQNMMEPKTTFDHFYLSKGKKSGYHSKSEISLPELSIQNPFGGFYTAKGKKADTKPNGDLSEPINTGGSFYTAKGKKLLNDQSRINFDALLTAVKSNKSDNYDSSIGDSAGQYFWYPLGKKQAANSLQLPLQPQLPFLDNRGKKSSQDYFRLKNSQNM